MYKYIQYKSNSQIKRKNGKKKEPITKKTLYEMQKKTQQKIKINANKKNINQKKK